MATLRSITDAQLDEIVSVVAQLSPENLTCDGELSKAQVAARYQALTAKLEELGARYGLGAIDESSVFDEVHHRELKSLLRYPAHV